MDFSPFLFPLSTRQGIVPKAPKSKGRDFLFSRNSLHHESPEFLEYLSGPLWGIENMIMSLCVLLEKSAAPSSTNMLGFKSGLSTSKEHDQDLRANSRFYMIQLLVSKCEFIRINPKIGAAIHAAEKAFVTIVCHYRDKLNSERVTPYHNFVIATLDHFQAVNFHNTANRKVKETDAAADIARVVLHEATAAAEYAAAAEYTAVIRTATFPITSAPPRMGSAKTEVVRANAAIKYTELSIALMNARSELDVAAQTHAKCCDKLRTAKTALNTVAQCL